MSLEFIISDSNLPTVCAAHEKDPRTSLLTLLSNHHTEILHQLGHKGVVLFRGFACDDLEFFSKAIELCNLGTRCSTKDYDIPRTLLPHEIYTSSDFPAHISLPLHHEKPRSKKPPNHLYFCCAAPAEQGGGTLFADAAAIWQNIPQAIQTKIKTYGVVYRQFFHGKTMKAYLLNTVFGKHNARGWSDYYKTHNKNEVEQKLSESQLSWIWQGSDLVVTNHLPGAVTHPLTGQELWFNSANYLNAYDNLLYGALEALSLSKYWLSRYLIAMDMLPIVCHYGNGDAFSPKDIKDINQVIKQHTWVLNWQKGDFIIVDNFTLMHGKESHKGNRLLYSCMTEL